MDLREKIGLQIKEARKSKGLTQKELGKMAGVTYQYIGQLERGEYLSIDSAQKYFKILGVEAHIYTSAVKKLDNKKVK